ncbi:aldehyde dehydrogenase domain-containing protein [Aspergillus pseudoustus]|uniref:aldehyde dehydrogenase (NAD(+)) n=1 Tax=Aspergillus pseudoustus TaxID=1810923 RepID=A0ABR4IVS8_9EURO
MTESIIKPRMLINGELVNPSDGVTFPLYNPATREKVAEVPEATADDTNAAVAAAKAAFPAWSALGPAQRGTYFKTLARLIRENNTDLARLEAISMGRPMSQYIDGGTAADHFDHYAESWSSIQGQTSLHTPGHFALTLRQPYGVVAAIIPWNLPLVFLAGKSAPALITGNTVVVKTSEKAPLAAARLAELIQQAGFPRGVFNVISGHGNPSGATLAAHMDVRVLSFTGSGRTGRLIQEVAARTNLKKVILELGGKSPAIVFGDADIPRAARETARSIQWNSGQVCMASSRVYVQKSVVGPFLDAYKAALEAVQAGDPTDQSVSHGPQADEAQYEAVLRYIEDGKQAAGELVLGGEGKFAEMKGYFIEPTVFVDTPEDARVMCEEIFGPVVSVNTFDTEDEVIAKANATDFGLYASVFTRDLDRAIRLTKALESGYVAVNCSSPTVAPDLPFGGYKLSGQGREGWLHSMDNFLESKSVLIRLEDGGSE